MRRIAMGLTALAALALTATGGGLLGARPAAAHAQLQASDPRADSTVTTQIDQITLTFSELVRGDFSTVVVTGPDGARHTTGPPEAVDKQVRLPVEPVRSGDYRVAYRVVSADGHPIQGQFRFTVALPPALEPAGAPTGAPATAGHPSMSPAVSATNRHPGGGVGRWAAGLALACAGLACAGLVLLRRRRRPAAR
ncbi:copper resistance protein CopC [Solwaraspora sp. WMMD1047]|uniref:copper resistance CopC family protein n=1 Tax=Solwaraspora sp. WMMD1047 TaxID=3016102 RepID=UPI002417040F|nr:copper resistance CopC family protein [Solwaraspora sp. WMMD1047]MDG4832952.1 copper resistance protein CopC [Solwaraspora sp. WMMD1047]